MTIRSVTRMYDSYEDASAVVRDLEAAGISHNDISLIANADAHGRDTTSSTARMTGGGTHPADPADPDDSNAGAGAKRGAVVGGVLGGGAGLLAGIGAIAIPGLGPVVAAGWLVAALTGVGAGAASGGLIGSLTGAGVSQDEAHVYAEGVRRGGSLVTVRVTEATAATVESVLDRRTPVNWRERRDTYGTDWRGFDENAAAGTASTAGYRAGDVPPRI